MIYSHASHELLQKFQWRKSWMTYLEIDKHCVGFWLNVTDSDLRFLVFIQLN